MRAACLALVVVLAGCCRADPALLGPPAHTVHLVHNGFHSSLLVPSSIDPQTRSLAEQAPWIEVGFSDLAWTVDGEVGTRHAIRLGLVPDTGAVEFGLYLDPLDLITDPSIEGHRAIALSAAGWQAMQDRLRWWVDLDDEIIGIVDGRSYIVSHRSFSAYNSCNDFVADLLLAAGLPICPRPWRTAEGLMDQVDAALARRARLIPAEE